MLIEITITRIAQSQQSRTGFTLDDAADLIIAQAENSTRLGVAVDAFDLAVAVAPKLGVGLRQELGIVQSVVKKTGCAIPE
jgi:hypothetical protein